MKPDLATRAEWLEAEACRWRERGIAAEKEVERLREAYQRDCATLRITTLLEGLREIAEFPTVTSDSDVHELKAIAQAVLSHD